MCDYATNEEIGLFLEKAKELISRGRYDFVPRRKNMQSLAAHGLTIRDAKEELLDLRNGDYYKGPKQDFDRPGVIWEFRRDISGVRFYIKVKIVMENGSDILKCLGFHKDDFE